MNWNGSMWMRRRFAIRAWLQTVSEVCGELEIAAKEDDQPGLSRFAVHGADLSDDDDFYSLPRRREPSAGRIFLAGADQARGGGAGVDAGRIDWSGLKAVKKLAQTLLVLYTLV